MDHSAPDEKDVMLLQKLREEGDHQAFTQLYNKYRKWLTVVGISLLGDDNYLEAQDLVQEFFIDFWHRELYRSVGPPYNIKLFLYRSIRNRCLDKIRRKKTAKSRAARFKMLANTFQLPENRLETHERQLQLVNAIQKLPPMTARIFRLTYVEDMSRDETASAMQISPHTVKNQLMRARKILGQLLEKPRK